MKTLVFDIKGDYAHYKKIYATTTAITYPIPTKPSLYGYLWAVGALECNSNKDYYLKYFQEKSCLIAIEVRKPIVMQRINTNLRPHLVALSEKHNRKPTIMEYVYNPVYRIYFQHKNEEFYENVKRNLVSHTPVYTPTLGLANLISNFEFIGEFETSSKTSHEMVVISSVVPKKKFMGFDSQNWLSSENEIIEQSMYPVEIDLERNITERDDVLFDRTAKPFKATVTEYYEIKNLANVVFF